MASCKEMKKGQIYECKECGLQLQVVNECEMCSASSQSGCLGSVTCSEEVQGIGMARFERLHKEAGL